MLFLFINIGIIIFVSSILKKIKIIDFESRIHVKISTSNRCHNFYVKFRRRIDGESTKMCPLGNSLPNWTVWIL